MPVEQRVCLRRLSQREAMRDQVRRAYLLKHLQGDLQAAGLTKAPPAPIRDSADLAADEAYAAAVETPAEVQADRLPAIPRADDDAPFEAAARNRLLERLGIARQLVDQVGAGVGAILLQQARQLVMVSGGFGVEAGMRTHRQRFPAP